MKTLYDRLLWIAREAGVSGAQKSPNKAVAALIGRSPGRATQIKNEGEGARIDGEALQRVTQLGFSVEWINEGRGEPRIKDATFLPALPGGKTAEERAALLADAVSAILRASGFAQDQLGTKEEIVARLTSWDDASKAPADANVVKQVTATNSHKGNNQPGQQSKGEGRPWDVPTKIETKPWVAPTENDEKKSQE